MNFRECITMQITACLMIFSIVKTAAMIDIQFIQDMGKWAEKQLSINYTREMIDESIFTISDKAEKVGNAVTAAVFSANDRSISASPLGEADSNGIQIVYAPAGGKVIDTGISSEAGMYVRIRHDDKIAVYGNLSDAAVITGERIKKGDIVGSYNKNKEIEFYYEIYDEDFSAKISA